MSARRAAVVLILAAATAVGSVHADDRIPPMTRTQWVSAVMRHTNGVTRVEARHIWRHPKLRRAMPIASTTRSHGETWVSPAALSSAATGGCHVSTSRTEYGYGWRMVGGTPIPFREPLFRYTLHKTWTFDGWQVIPGQVWDDDFIAPFADLRWNFAGAFDIEDVWFAVGGSAHATQRSSRKGQFHSIVQLGGAETNVARAILAKWHGGWEADGHSAHFCGDN